MVMLDMAKLNIKISGGPATCFIFVSCFTDEHEYYIGLMMM